MKKDMGYYVVLTLILLFVLYGIAQGFLDLAHGIGFQ